ncbi:MAG: ATP-binding protein [Candidatus Hodarchaeaceae archaeon]|nr:ATP-binding protein [Candidatus Hodarchaeaceae archaeon]
MLFDPEPKKDKKDFYNREAELQELLESIKREKFVVIQGIRRLGKSSLLNVALAESKHPFVRLDLREVYFTYGSVSKFHLYRALSQELSKLSRIHRFTSWLEKVRGVKIAGFEIQLDWREKGASLTDIFRAMDGWASARGEKVVIAIDEAQYLRLAGRTRYDGLLAWAIDNLGNLVFALTGSQVGVLQDFLGTEDPRAPLYGRHARIIELGRLSHEQAMDFLKEGFKEAGVKHPDLGEVVDALDGLIGWLTLYGYTYVSEGKAELDRFLKMAAKLAAEESKKILRWSDRYQTVLRAVAGGALKWSEIRERASVKLGPISKSDLTYLLDKLVRYGYLERLQNGSFVIPDPVIRYMATKF